ncbi:MAG: ATPase, T2SS/T4P/T4SS family [Gallionellaceae bacterium]
MDTENKTYPKLSKAMASAGAEFPRELERSFQRILGRIEFLWGEKEAIKYLDSLLLEDRKGRKGFPMEVISEIAQVKQVHNFLYPTLDITPFDPFSASGILPPVKQQRADQAEFETSPVQDIQAGNIREKIVTPTAPPETEEMAGKRNSKTHDKRRKPEWPIVSNLHDLYATADLRHKGANLYALQSRQIGEILMHYGLIDEQSLRVVSRMQKRAEHADKPLGQILVEIGIIGQQELDRALCVQTGINMVDVLSLPIPPEVQNLIPVEIAREKQVVPAGNYQGTLFLACTDPFWFRDASYFTVLTGLKVEPVYAPRNEIVNRLNMYGAAKNMDDAKTEFRDLAQKSLDSVPVMAVNAGKAAQARTDVSENDATIINLVDKLIQNAIAEGASDIHIELFQHSEETEIRFRRDGRLENFFTFPRAYHLAVVSRIKIMAGLDISERRRPQDGKISFGLADGESRTDLRVSIIPTIRGNEFVTMRILGSGEPLPLGDLGLADRDLNIFRGLFHHSFGLVLVCGPTGSGRTTTLHSVLRELNTGDSKIWTAEDPVEIVQPHLCQVQINNKAGVTFANILRSFLRADPDIVMIGEMRDQETARIALQASMTHLVLSTLHTNSASETVARLVDLQVDPYNLSDALLAILAQRLVRKLCPECAKRVEASTQDLEELANEYYMSSYDTLPSLSEREDIIGGWHRELGKDGKLYLSYPVGCKSCNGGYKGRIGLYELLQATPQVRHLIRHRSSATQYREASVTEGMRTLKQDGIEKVIRGITDLAQVHIACT